MTGGSVQERRLMGLLVYCGLITAMTSSLGALLVAEIADHFDLGIGAAQWVVTSSLLAGAVTTPFLGRLGDGHRTKAVLVGMLLLIVAGSVICCAATWYPLLLVGRVLQGLTFGVVPVCINVARHSLPPDRVPAAVAVLSVTTATGVGIGFPLTGLLADQWGFRVAFAAALVVQLPALALITLRLRQNVTDAVPPVSGLPSTGGAVLLVGGMVLFVGGVSGNLLGYELPAFVAGVVLLGAWTWSQTRARRPLLAVRLLRDRRVLLAHLTATLIGASMHVAVVSICQIAQAPTTTAYGLGASLFLTGCFVLPLSIGSQVASRRSHRGLGLRRRIGLGAVAAATGNAAIMVAGQHVVVLLAAMLLFGLGIGLCWAAAPPLIMAATPAAEAGSMLAFNQILRPLGGAAGTALAGWVLSSHTGSSGWPSSRAFDTVFALNLANCLMVLVLVAATRLQPSSSDR